nr:protein RRNAD1 [Pogona vitticeps]
MAIAVLCRHHGAPRPLPNPRRLNARMLMFFPALGSLRRWGEPKAPLPPQPCSSLWRARPVVSLRESVLLSWGRPPLSLLPPPFPQGTFFPLLEGPRGAAAAAAGRAAIARPSIKIRARRKPSFLQELQRLPPPPLYPHNHPARMFARRGFSLEDQKRLVGDITRLLSLYGHLADAYIIEFFTDHLWGRLPASWQAALDDLPSPQLAALLLDSRHPEEDICYGTVWPLSLLAFKAAAHALAFPRRGGGRTGLSRGSRPEEFQENPCQSSSLDPLFRKHVKPKKQHEIQRLGQVVKRLSEITGSCHVIDVGSGQGHLSRYLALGLHLRVTGVEGDAQLVARATKFDQELIQAVKKEQARGTLVAGAPSVEGPDHVVGWVDPRAPWPEFLRLLQLGKEGKGPPAVDRDLSAGLGFPGSNKAKNCHSLTTAEQGRHAAERDEGSRREDASASLEEPRQVAGSGGYSPTSSEGLPSEPPRPGSLPLLLTGLHACGDLSVALLRHFVHCPDVVGITSVACCYMKLTSRGDSPLSGPSPSEHGYPLSRWVSALPGHRLSYKAREGACHALEDFARKLQEDSPALRTHCFRATLEVMIRAMDPAKKRLGVQTIKKAHQLTFEQYARLGLQRLGLGPCLPLEPKAVAGLLAQQQKVVAFSSLALLLAPLVETLLLVDRMIYLQEQGFQCELLPLFDPQFSPRNFVLVAAKGPSGAAFPGPGLGSET